MVFGPLMNPGAQAQAPAPNGGDFMSNPAIQAALFNAGIALMRPNWGGAAAALPDALSAGANTLAAVEQEEYMRSQKQAEADRRSSEAAADRENRIAAAKIAADSRAEVANIRGQAQMDALQYRLQFTGPPKTPQEQKLYSDIYRSQLQVLEQSALINGMNKEQIERAARERAQESVVNFRATFGTPGASMPGAGETPPAGTATPPGTAPGAAVPGQKTSPNPATPASPGGTVRPAQAPKITSPNETPPIAPGAQRRPGDMQPGDVIGGVTPRPATAPAAQGLTAQEAVKRIPQQYLDKVMKDPTLYEKVRSQVRDPETLDLLRKQYQ